MKKFFKRLLAAPFVLIAAILILLEDWLWDDLERLAAAIGRLPILRQLESMILRLPPYGALVLFAAPSLLLIPVKLAAFWLIAHGRPTAGFAVVIAAKFVGTALVAHLYLLTQQKLLSIAWFATLHTSFVAFKTRIYAAIKSTAIYHATHIRYQQLKAGLKEFAHRRRGMLKRRWDAALKLSRRR
jgi:hypothetical protein